jgi:Methyltransferase domain
MTKDTLERAEALLSNLPKLHIWGGRPQVGGLNRQIADRLVAEITPLGSPTIAETGAGATTLLFLCLEPHALISIAPDAALEDRVRKEADARGIATDALRFYCERSELVLPRLADSGQQIDAALIDGNHGWPSVFVDFCYLNLMLREGGVLFVDDVQLHSVGQLFHLLRQQDEFELLGVDSKLATFRKVLDRAFLPDWRAEPFIRMNSLTL